MADESAQEAADKAVDQERLLEGENPETPYLEDAAHWVTVYSELLAVKRDLVGVSEDRLPDMPKAASSGAATAHCGPRCSA
jgi:hypothetical protein